ncbi:MAG: lysylphosphatidylglycerol synthase transmembrane domain-containing protein [bacterium]
MGRVTLSKGLWWMIIFALVFYFVLAVVGDIGDVVRSFREFSIVFLFFILLLSLLNYNLRFIKWDFLLRQSSIYINRWTNYSIFMAGFAGTVSPGKSGELIKPLFLSDILGIPLEKTIPVFFFERLTDLIALIFLSFLGIFVGRKDFLPIVVLGGFLIIILFFFTNPNFWKLMFGIIGKRPQKGVFKLIYDISVNIQDYWNLRLVLVTLFLSIISWSFEGIGYYIVFKGFNNLTATIPFFKSIFIYSVSSIFGAVSFIPGGLGIMDGSLTAFAASSGICGPIAVSSTIIIRAATLWFAFIIGLGFFVYIRYKFSNNKERQ